MKIRHMALAAGLTLWAWPVLADNHGSSGGGHSSGGGSHASSSGSHSSSSSHGSSSGNAISRGGSGVPSAGLRHPIPGTGHGYYNYGFPYYGRGFYGGYGYPYYGLGFGFSYPYNDWYSPYYYGGGYGYPYYYPYYDSGGYGGGGGYAYPEAPAPGTGEGAGAPPSENGSYRQGSQPEGAIRVMVDPTDAKVFVDGRLAGVVEDFNSTSRHLYLPPGNHEITLKADGFKSHRFRVMVYPGAFVNLRYDMEKGQGDDPNEDVLAEGGVERSPGIAIAPTRHREEWGGIRLDIEPDDASVYVDGAFRGTARQAQSLQVPAGHHRIEIVKPGFKTFSQEMDINEDHPADIRLTLERP